MVECRASGEIEANGWLFFLSPGIVTAETLDQAIERSGTKAGNKGFDAALTSLEMTDLWRVIDEG